MCTRLNANISLTESTHVNNRSMKLDGSAIVRPGYPLPLSSCVKLLHIVHLRRIGLQMIFARYRIVIFIRDAL